MLSPTQRALIEPLRHGEPVTVNRLISTLYGRRYDGGPDDAANVVRQIIFKARRKLAKHQIVIVTVGSRRWSRGWMVEPAHRAALEALLDKIGNDRGVQRELSSSAMAMQAAGGPK